MENHGIKMIGDLKTDNIKSKTGTVAVQIDNNGKLNIQTSVRFLSGSPSASAVFRSIDGNGNMEFALPSIPLNEIILFESDTVITGYTLLTDINDELIYITKGSAAGGDSGSSQKTSSTWTQPTHVHATNDHTLTINETPAHTHTVKEGSSVPGGSDENLTSGDDYTNSIKYYSTTSSKGGGGAHNHGNTDASNTANTWRPLGRNYTRQQRTS